MTRPHRRFLVSDDGGCYEEGHWFACPPPPPPTVPSSPDFGPGPGPGPSPSFPPIAIPPWACPPGFPLAPAPAHNGRRDQGGGMHGNWPPPPPGAGSPGDHDRRQIVRYALIAAGVIAFVSLILLGVSVAVRRRQVRRRRQALLAAPSLNAGGDDGGGGHDHEWGGGGGVVHHVWNIRTVGLDEASIGSIAVTRFRAGAGLLGAADCSVCLGEFQDGELVRLLPKCAHAFHVPCIDTWLRAHVSCPICRSDVLDPAVVAAADSGGGGEGTESVGSSASPPHDPDASADAAAADQPVGAAASDAAPDHGEEESDGRDASPAEEEDQQERSSSAEPPPPCPLPRNVRRAASMDAAAASTAADVAELDRLPEEAPEEEQIGGRRKPRWTGPSRAKASGSGHWSNLGTDRLAAPGGGVPRSFFSRHSRARSSVLPL